MIHSMFGVSWDQDAFESEKMKPNHPKAHHKLLPLALKKRKKLGNEPSRPHGDWDVQAISIS